MTEICTREIAPKRQRASYDKKTDEKALVDMFVDFRPKITCDIGMTIYSILQARRWHDEERNRHIYAPIVYHTTGLLWDIALMIDDFFGCERRIHSYQGARCGYKTGLTLKTLNGRSELKTDTSQLLCKFHTEIEFPVPQSDDKFPPGSDRLNWDYCASCERIGVTENHNCKKEDICLIDDGDFESLTDRDERTGGCHFKCHSCKVNLCHDHSVVCENCPYSKVINLETVTYCNRCASRDHSACLNCLFDHCYVKFKSDLTP